jgi:hypothetical protein
MIRGGKNNDRTSLNLTNFRLENEGILCKSDSLKSAQNRGGSFSGSPEPHPVRLSRLPHSLGITAKRVILVLDSAPISRNSPL